MILPRDLVSCELHRLADFTNIQAEDWHSHGAGGIDFIRIFGIILYKSKGKTIERWRRKAIGTNDEMRLHTSMSASCDQQLKSS